ncbi:MAG: TIGR01666 family membrane protein [Curvibacter sp.]|nr:MAG: TIGR01666 family membrane protein [Curvibacter sp.]
MWSPVWQMGWRSGWHYKFLLKGVRALIALTAVVAGAWWLDETAALIPLVLGVNASALAETDDSWRGRLRALLITLLCFAAMALAVQFTLHSKPALMAVLALAAVGLALLGALSESYRAIGSATLILGLYTALAAHGDGAAAPGLPHALLLLSGAAWYGLLSVCWAAWFPNLQVVQNLALLYEALGEYLRLKSRLFEPVRGVDIERRRVGLALQNGRVVQALNQTKESLLSRRPRNAGPTLETAGPRWLRLALQQYLVAQDLHERASSSHENYELLAQSFFHSDVLYRCQRVLAGVGQDCSRLAEALRLQGPVEAVSDSQAALEDLQGSIALLETLPELAWAQREQGAGAPVRLRSLRALARNLDGMQKVIRSALWPEQYPLPQADTSLLDRGPRNLAEAWARIRRQFSASSVLLRHGLRLAVALMVAFVWMTLSGDEHGFWILLTIVFVCRPHYGDTLRRLGQRVGGTVLGLMVGWALLKLFPGLLLQSVFTVVAGVVFVAARQTRYTLASGAITILVLLAFNQVGNGFDLILPRLLDTLIGALIAGLTVWLVLPSWQSRQLPRLAAQLLRSQADYLREIARQYQSGKREHLDYRLARRNAHNADAALSGALREVFDEPAYLRRHGAAGMRFMVQAHTLLNYLSALGAHRLEDQAQDFAPDVAQAVELLLNALADTAQAIEGGALTKAPVDAAALAAPLADGVETGPDLVLRSQLHLALSLVPELQRQALALVGR